MIASVFLSNWPKLVAWSFPLPMCVFTGWEDSKVGRVISWEMATSTASRTATFVLSVSILELKDGSSIPSWIPASCTSRSAALPWLGLQDRDSDPRSLTWSDSGLTADWRSQSSSSWLPWCCGDSVNVVLLFLQGNIFQVPLLFHPESIQASSYHLPIN